MCSHYAAAKAGEYYEKHFGVKAPADSTRADLWPGYVGSFIRADAFGEREALAGMFGLLPHWAKDEKLARSTFNARSETAATKPSFRDAWRRGQRCIIPAAAIYEPDWRTGKAIATRIERLDGKPMAIAGLWSQWCSPTGADVLSYTMLTINADDHALMQNMHKPDDEKRMVVILPDSAYSDWLAAPTGKTMDFLTQYPAKALHVVAT
jgi:putative SOS response-associated peptidase YedK